MRSCINSQKGVSLVIIFLIITIMLAIILNVSIVLFREVKIISHIGNSVSSLSAAKSGIEKTLYFDKKQIPTDASRGLCDICNSCDTKDCRNCSTISLAVDGSNGCDKISCVNCQVSYNSIFDDIRYTVDAKVTPSSSSPDISDLYIKAIGFYRDTENIFEHMSFQTAATNPVPIIKNISPSSASRGSQDITLTINGNKLIPSSVVKFNGEAKTTTFVSSRKLTALIPASNLEVKGLYPVTVTNPSPGGGTSNSKNFRVKSAGF